MHESAYCGISLNLGLAETQRLAENALSKKANGADIEDKTKFIDNIGLKDTVNRAYNALNKYANGADITDKSVFVSNLNFMDQVIRTDLINGNQQRIQSELIVDNRLTVTNEVYCQSGNAAIALKSTKGGPHIAYTWNNSQWHDVRFPEGKGTAIVLGANCWITGDGYLKLASPIIKIWREGKFETNNESEGAIVERLSEGVYLIKNVLGFNADAAWGGVDGGVDIPLCKNKLPLIWVNYKVLPDGSIKLMTYHREHADAPAFARNVREGYADGDPIDIPSGRFISVRVQMPENSIWNQQQRKLAESK
ncbi:hypothetical protein [Xenorhabdus griffiniae]|uniref:phage tail fiber protein n=2 Tax=Xenorhabdus griffiniae TaxID=351672 RepID=UPI0030CCDA87